MRIEEYLELVADAVSKRSKCRRQVGCVLADSKGRILSTGYNGLPAGGKNCTAETCTNPPGASDGYCEAYFSITLTTFIKLFLISTS